MKKERKFELIGLNFNLFEASGRYEKKLTLGRDGFEFPSVFLLNFPNFFDVSTF